MSGRPVRLLTAAAIAAAVSLLSISTASAGCHRCGCGPVRPSSTVVYNYAYPAPIVYARRCAHPAPMYVVNQGPTYTAPVTLTAEPTPFYGYKCGYRRAYSHHRRHWHRGCGYRHAVVSPRLHHGYRHHHRYGVVPRHLREPVPLQRTSPGSVHPMGAPK